MALHIGDMLEVASWLVTVKKHTGFGNSSRLKCAESFNSIQLLLASSLSLSLMLICPSFFASILSPSFLGSMLGTVQYFLCLYLLVVVTTWFFGGGRWAETS
jgi:hypothetical protein